MTAPLTIDELARVAGTTVRQVRALQTQGLLSRPTLVGRTGFYTDEHLERLRAVLRLQRQGFSLAGIAVLLRALQDRLTVEQVVGLRPPASSFEPEGEPFEGWPEAPKGRLLSVVPTTWLEQPEAS